MRWPLSFLVSFWVITLSAQDCDTTGFFLDEIKDDFRYQDTIITQIDYRPELGQGYGLYRSLQQIKCFKDRLFKEYYISMLIRGKKKERELSGNHLSDSEIGKYAQSSWNYQSGHGRPNYACCSYIKSSDNWYTLTFLADGKYAPGLILINYAPNGEFNSGRTIQSSFTDAGEYYVTSSIRTKDTLIISDVIKWETFYPEDGKYMEMTDSTVTRYILKPSGELKYLDNRTIKFEK